MKKRFTRIMAALALLVFMMPNLMAWGQTKITDYTSIVSGTRYYIGATTGSTDYYLSVDGSSLSTSIAGTAVTSQSDATPFTFAGSGTTWTIQFDNGYYLSLKTSKDNGKVQVVENAANFTASNQSSKIRMQISGANYSIQKNNSGTQFGSYGNTQTDIWLMEVPSGPITYTVTYDCNGGTSGCPENLTDIEAGTSINLADAPTKTDYTFNGWSDGTTIYYAGASYTVNDDVTMTAQWQPSISYLFYESFNDCEGTGGNDGQWSGSIASSTLVSDNEDWTFANGNGAYKCAKFGTGSKLGSAQTPTISHTGNATLTFKAAAWNGSSENTTLKLSVTSGTLSATTVTLEKGAWTNYTISITGITTSTQIKFEGNSASNSRFFLDEVMVVEAALPSEPYITAGNVEITYDATSGSIMYEIANYEEGTMAATTDADWISDFTYEQADEIGEVGFTTTENNTLYARTATITLTYTYGDNQNTTAEVTVTQTGNSSLPGGANNPYTVAQAIEATPESGNSDFIYVHGIVSGIVEAYSSQYHNISYNISDDGTTTSAQLEAFRGKGLNNANFTSEDDIKAGDIVTIYGQLTNYNGTIELASGNYLTAFERPTNTEPSITPGSYEFSVSSEGEEGVLEVTYQNITEVAAEVYFCDAEGNTATYDWITAEINNANNVEYLVEPNDGAARTAYFKVWAYDDEMNEVYSDLVTVSQGAPAVIDLRGVLTPLIFNAGSFTSSGNGYQDYDEVTYTGNNNVDYAGWTLKQVMKSGNNMQMAKNGAGQVIMPTIKTDYGFTLMVTAVTNSVLVSDGSKSTETTFSTTATSANVVISTSDKYAVISTITIIPTPYILTINGYADDNVKDGYYLIASPVTVDPATVEGMTEGSFDLYYYDHNANDGLEWRNYEAETFNLVPGTGYLYAKKATTEGETFSFNLTGTPYNGDGVIPTIAGWNLIGNPFGVEAEISADYYAMNQAGSELTPVTASTNVAAMQGVFVYTETASSVIFVEAATNGGSDGKGNLALNVSGNRGNVIDRAIIRFGEGEQLPKFQLNPNNTKIYFAQADNDYAVVRSASEGEMPVSFRASENGTYTLSFSAENTEMRYMHLIDNMTGNDIDLLQTPSYSFEAKTTDYANRFRIVFKANTNVEEMSADRFAFYNGSEWVINSEGEATLQVIDMMGRVVSSQIVNGNANVNINDAKGVYVIRLIQNDLVKTQKIVKE